MLKQEIKTGNKIILLILFLLIISVCGSLVIAEDSSQTSSPDTKEDNEVKIGKTTIKKSSGIDYEKEGEDDKTVHKFDFKSEGSITVDYKGKETRTYSGFETGKKTEFIFDATGSLKEAYFTTSKDGNYKLGDKEFNIPKGSQVVFKDGKARIKIPGEARLKKPETVSGFEEEDIVLEYESQNGFILDNGDKLKGILKYQDGFFIDGDSSLGSIEIKNPSNIRTYLLYDGNIHPEIKTGYISMNKASGKIVVGSNINVRGPVVKFLEGNPYGVKIEKGDNFAMQALGNSQGSYISVQNRNKQGKVPLVKTLNQYVMNYDNKGVYYNSNKQRLYVRAKSVVIKDFGDNFKGSSSTPLEIHNFKTINNKEVSVSKYGNVLGISNINGIGYGKNPRFIKTHVLDYYKNKMKAPNLFTGFSNSLTYNYDITERGFEKLTGVRLTDRVGTLRNRENVRMIIDMFMGIPLRKGQTFRNWGIIEFEITSSGGWSGLADPRGIFYVNYYRGGFAPTTIRHEMTHMHDFVMGNNFEREWNAVGGPDGPHTWSYGYSGAEDTSTFAEMIYKDSWNPSSGSFSSWNQGLNSKRYGKQIRGKAAVFEKYGFLSMSETKRIFQSAGLKYNSQLREKYISEGKSR